MHQEKRRKVVTDVKDLMRSVRPQATIDTNDPFVTKESCLKYSSLHSKHENKIPLYMEKNSNLLTELTTFSHSTWDSINKLQIQREKKRDDAEEEKNRIAEAQKEVEKRMGEALNTKVDNILHVEGYAYKRVCPLRFPQKSCLNHSEHEAYLRAFIKFQIRGPKTPIEKQEFQQYQIIQNKVVDEQLALLEFAESVARNQIDNVNDVPSVIEQYIENYMKRHLPRIQDLPSKYVLEAKIPIKAPDSMKPIEMVYVGHLLGLGKIPNFKVLDEKYRCTLPQKESIGVQEATLKEKYKNNDTYVFQKQVSEDPNAAFLSTKHDADVVITASAFKVLSNNHDNFNKEWDIPVTIRLQKETNKRVVYIDKPLVRRTWLPLQKRRLFNKKAAHLILINKKNRNSFVLSKPFVVAHHNTEEADSPRSEDDRLVRYDDPFGPLEPMDIEFPPSESPIKENYKHSKGDSVDDTPKPMKKKQKKIKEDTFLDNIMHGQKTLLKTQTPKLKRAAQVTPNVQTYLDKKETKSQSNEKPWSRSLDTDWDLSQFMDLPPDINANYCYQYFEMKQPELEKSLKMIVRHKVHGITSYGQKFDERHLSKACVLDVKIEKQAYFGCEINTYSEIAEQWATLVVRPFTTMINLRTCIESSTVMMKQERNLDLILQEGKQAHVKFDPQIIVNSLYNIFQTLGRMAEGQYLLHHRSKSAAFIELLKADNGDKDGVVSGLYYDLEADFLEKPYISRRYVEPPFVPIDTHVLTPFHLKYKKIPATFPMRNPPSLQERRKKGKNNNNKKRVTKNVKPSHA